jgi:hypothetical protein
MNAVGYLFFRMLISENTGWGFYLVFVGLHQNFKEDLILILVGLT